MKGGIEAKKARCSEFIWIQRDGTPIHVRKMDDHHLLCTLRLLRRWSKMHADHYNSDNTCIWDAEDAKNYYWFEDDQFAKGHPTWSALQFERRVRGLDELPEPNESVQKTEEEE